MAENAEQTSSNLEEIFAKVGLLNFRPVAAKPTGTVFTAALCYAITLEGKNGIC